MYHMSKVPIRCILGCKVDTHCSDDRRCYKNQCVPKTCPEVSKCTVLLCLPNDIVNGFL